METFLQRAVRSLYGLGLRAAQPLLRRKLARRGVAEPGYLEAVEERFGRYDTAAPAASGLRIWVHAVSLGETRAAAVLVAALRERLPGMQLLLTHGTATGRAEGTRLLQPGDLQAWQPWDTPGAVARFLAHFRPSMGLLMETEVWPNLVAGCRQAGVPLCLANARLSAKSLREAERLAVLAQPAFGGLAAVWAQSDGDAERLRTLQAPVHGVFGNLKFDMAPDPALLARGQAWHAAAGRPVLLFASSREGEEQLWIEALGRFRSLAQAGRAQGAADSIANRPLWLIVPRHPQRFDAVAALLQDAGLTVARRSTWGDAPPVEAAAADVWLGDSLGEMALYYGAADAALLGGSFAPLGGQNLIEAAACGCPVVTGPSTFNFAEAADGATAAGAAFRTTGIDEAIATACRLIDDPAALAAAQAAGRRFAAAHRGAAARTADAAVALLRNAAAERRRPAA